MSENNSIQVDNSQITAAALAAVLPTLMRESFSKPYHKYRDATADNPAMYPAQPQFGNYTKAMVERIQEFEPGYSAEKIAIINPAKAVSQGITEHASKAGNTRIPEAAQKWYADKGHEFAGLDNVIAINPHHDRAALAHEMGHTVTQRTKLGNLIHKAKTEMRRPGTPLTLPGMAKIAAQNEGKTVAQKAKAILRAPGASRQAAMLATALIPGMASVLTPGSDDTATALALAYAINAPTLLDEAFATGEGLGIMKRAGTPATIGQRSRLAGAFATYLMAPTVTALAANSMGNFLDEND
jgi:hypothetical protein